MILMISGEGSKFLKGEGQTQSNKNSNQNSSVSSRTASINDPKSQAAAIKSILMPSGPNKKPGVISKENDKRLWELKSEQELLTGSLLKRVLFVFSLYCGQTLASNFYPSKAYKLSSYFML
jgi:hypothetical protein